MLPSVVWTWEIKFVVHISLDAHCLVYDEWFPASASVIAKINKT